LGLLLHTASRRQLWRLPTAVTACSCLQLAVATNSPRKGLSPPIQCPCQAHLPAGDAVASPSERHRAPCGDAVDIAITATGGWCSADVRPIVWSLLWLRTTG